MAVKNNVKLLKQAVKIRSALLCGSLFFSANVFCFPGGSPESAIPPRRSEEAYIASGFSEGPAAINGAPVIAAPENAPAAASAAGAAERPAERGKQVMSALSKAYPRLLSEAVFRDGDWSVEMRGKRYYYSEGRILPEELRGKADSYSPQPFYDYSEDLPEWKPPTPENAARYAAMSKQRRTAGAANRAQIFYDDLWQIHNKAESWERQKTISFLGRKILVHHAILEELAMVEQAINKAAALDPQVKRWVSALQTVSAWNWRDIADTRSRSNHAYGIAVDLLASPQNRLETYWLWTAQKNADWWNVPYSKRANPPDAVIKAFESYGFVWGGKWLFYDTMHFEYRPEIFFLSGIPPRGEY
jgi:hypothetical protein